MSDRFVKLDGRAVAVALALLAAAMFALMLPTLAHAEGEEAPSVLNQSPTGVAKTSAILNGLVNPNGAEVTECEFEYGTSPTALEQTAPCYPSPEAGENFVEVSAPVSGLHESTKYYYRVVAVSAFGEGIGAPLKTFTTLPTKPGITTGDQTGVTRSGATLHGAVNPNDANVTRCEFLVSTTPSFETASHAACSVLPGAGEKFVQVDAPVSGLTEHTTYYYRLIAENSFGEGLGSVLDFKTPPRKPDVSTEGPSGLTRTSVTLNGVVNPRGSEVISCEFEYGPSIAFGSKVPCSSLPMGTGESGIAVSAELSGLPESATYYYRVVATNGFGTAFGNHSRFTTYPSAPKVLTQGATHQTADSAQLNATVNPAADNVTSCEFEWGTSVAYGKRAPCSSPPGAGESPVAVSAPLAGLAGNTTYDFRIVATNALGTSFGGNIRFTTEVGGQKPTVTKLSPNKGSTAGGTTVKIKGSGFTEGATVLFGSVSAKSVTVKNGTELVVVSPAESAGKVAVTVTTSAGTSEPTAAAEFLFKEPRM